MHRNRLDEKKNKLVDDKKNAGRTPSCGDKTIINKVKIFCVKWTNW